MKLLPENNGVLVEEPEYFGERSFSNEAIKAFPELAAELSQETDLLHVQIGILASAARDAFKRDDAVLVRRILNFLEQVLSYKRLHPEIENAIAISFLLPIDFDKSETGREAWQSLPKKLRDILDRAA
jgi:hypothetical protein